MKDLGQLHHFLGVTVEPHPSGLLLHQRRRPGYDSSWRNSTARSPRARSSTATTSAPCIPPPTPSSISGRSVWRSTYTSCVTVAIGDVRVLHVPTTSQFADIFTKGLPSSTFSEFRSSLNVAGG